MQPGDVYMTNDPWRGTGHLFDFTVVTPTFHKGKLVAIFACTAHVADIGGNGPDPHSRDVFAEGLFLPIMPLAIKGEISKWLMKLLCANSREPEKLEGDVYALIASNEAGGGQLTSMMGEYKLETLDDLSHHILSSSDRSMREAIAQLPKGTWSHQARIDGFADPVDLCATLTIDDETIRIDFAGTSPVSKYGINCPICYTDAYTSFGVKCLVAPRLANNAAVLARIVVTAPEGTIVNAPFPSPVTARAHRPDAARCRLRLFRKSHAGPRARGRHRRELEPAFRRETGRHRTRCERLALSRRRISRAAAWARIGAMTALRRRPTRPA